VKGDGPESSFASETRKMTLQDRVRPRVKGPSGYVLLGVALALAGALIWVLIR